MTTHFSKIIVLSVLLGGFYAPTNAMWRSFTARASGFASRVSRYVGKSLPQFSRSFSSSWNTTYSARNSRFAPAVTAAAGATLLRGNVAYADEGTTQDLKLSLLKETLHHSCKSGNENAVRTILMIVNKNNDKKELDLEKAIDLARKHGHTDIVGRLELVDAINKDGSALLENAILQGDNKKAIQLVCNGAEISYQAGFLAAMCKMTDVINVMNDPGKHCPQCSSKDKKELKELMERLRENTPVDWDNVMRENNDPETVS